MAWPEKQAVVLSVHDGDTVNVSIILGRAPYSRSLADVDLGWGIHLLPTNGSVALVNTPIRLLGINAPELSTLPGITAREFLRVLLAPVIAQAQPVTLRSEKWDKYAPRTDASVILPDGRDVSRIMLDAGMAVPYNV